MLIVRDAQLSVFREAAIRDFVEQLACHLEVEYPDRLASRDRQGLVDFIYQTIATANANRMETAGAIAVFIELMMEYGEKFDLAPSGDRTWAHNILAHPTLPDYVKVEAIRERFSRRTDGRRIVPVASKAR